MSFEYRGFAKDPLEAVIARGSENPQIACRAQLEHERATPILFVLLSFVCVCVCVGGWVGGWVVGCDSDVIELFCSRSASEQQVSGDRCSGNETCAKKRNSC